MSMIGMVLLIVTSAATVAAQPWEVCGTTGKYAAGSTYQANLDLLSAALPSNASSTGLFAKGSAGAAPDAVHGLVLCRGDLNASACRTCVADAFQGARRRCALTKDATVFYDTCLLRFSDQDFLGLDYSNRSHGLAVAVDRPVMPTEATLTGWDGYSSNAFIAQQVNKLLNGTVRQLFSSTTTANRYAATGRLGDIDGSNTIMPLFAYAQCAPDLTDDLCHYCLQNFSDLAMANIGRRAGRVLGLRCNLRYEEYQFYSHFTWINGDGTLNPATPPPSPTPEPAPLPPTPIVLPPTHRQRKKPTAKVLVIALVSPLLALFICVIISFRFMRRHIKVRADKAKMNLHRDEALIWGLEGRGSELKIYDFSQILEATGNFAEENKLGRGGFGHVYKGQFPDGLEVAVKRLASHSRQGFTEFRNEIQLIAKLQHTNLVRLLGCCYQGEERILVYEYLPNKSLDFFIFDKTRSALIDWGKRLAIVEGIAQGLLYLHKHSRLRVVHRDLKTSNILLDREMNPKISDFGLAKTFSTDDIEGNTRRIVGTYGYMAPEYASEGLFSIKSDVFSFGVLTLEIISGERTSSFHRNGEFINLIGHAWQLWKDGLWLQLVDASLVVACHTSSIMRCINIALLCVQENAAERPTMSDVVAMLSSETMALPEPKHPAYFHVRMRNAEAPTAVMPSSVNDITMSALDGR
ncbi:hypothetical protein SEVIR_2G010000v4 [Setaria viridis]|uniref:Uncharacterized protein n=1 Tax=Setaria viridis TaxID=4556 RepID=A0A4U6VK77_SETVI|nr:cysteine-rich receptor-like protein kinase 15 [Setaria viridis]TKW30070.1 hypothetical protein SEVIR_2G010000v2 [Setaria viridis]